MKNVKTNQMNACRCNSKGAGVKMTSWLNNNFRLLALTLLAVLSSSVWGDDWTKVSSVSEITSGGTFIIGYAADLSSDVIVPMQNSGSASTSSAGYMYSGTSNGGSGSETIDMSTITETTKYEVTIVASTVVEGAVCIKIGNNYLGNENTKNNCKLFAEESAHTAFTIFVDDENPTGDFIFQIDENESYYWLQYNSSSPRFAVYGGTQKNLVLYKKGSSCSNKVTVTKGAATGGSYTLKAGSASGAEISDGGTLDNCDNNATIVVVPNANSHYHCMGVTASNSTSVTGPDGSGNYTITYTKGSSISSAINVEFAEDTKYTIEFQDNIQSAEVENIEVYSGETFSFPVLTDKTAATEGTCEEVHYHFMGWVISTHTGEIEAGDIKTGTSAAVSADATYKAVWAAEEQE